MQLVHLALGRFFRMYFGEIPFNEADFYRCRDIVVWGVEK